MTHQPNLEPIMKLGLGFWGSKTLLSAVELNLFTELAAEPLSATTIRERLGLHERSVTDFLDALVALGMLIREDDKYGNTPDTAFFLDRNQPTYAGGMLEMANARLFAFWNQLTVALKTGEMQNEARGGVDFFGELYAEPSGLKVFLEGMTGISMGAAHAMAAKFPWNEYKTFADIGVAQGALPVAVCQEHKHLTGKGYDLAPVKPVFEEYVAKHGLSKRLTFHEGDFFADAELPKADVLVMGHILHDWDLEQKTELVKKAHAALPVGGSLIVYDAMIDNERCKNAFGLLMSLNMLIETPGGFDYTPADCEGWLKNVGFQTIRVEHLVGPDSMVIAVK